jgi:WD40 repeat protein/predicted Ser/Thr protein kinase
MKAIDPNASEADLDEALATWLELVESGVTPEETAFVARYPHLKDTLTAHLEDWRKVHAATHLVQAENRRSHETLTIRESHLSLEMLPGIAGYEIVGELGRGGMGVVYKARQVSLDRWVAIKMLRGIDSRRGAEKIRFQNEAAIIAQIDHPHIVPIYQVGEHDGRPYFVMKWIEGGSLASRLSGKRPVERVEQEWGARLVATLARAVHYAHERGILHRDLKPSNVLLDSTARPYVTDFGLAKRLDADGDTTQTGEVIGTPTYMAPEQASGKKNAVTTATDVYGLGAILYAMLTGRPPFEGESILDTLNQVRERDAAPPTDINSAVDRDLQTICLKCLRKDPHGRYASADELADDLERWLQGQPIHARPMTARERLVRWVTRRPALTAMIGMCLLATVGLIAGLLVYNHDIGKALTESDELRKAGLEREAVLRGHLFIADMRSARQHLDSGEDALALEVLNRYIPSSSDEKDLRDFAWYHMNAMCRYEPRVLGKHDAPALSLALSPDERWLATGDEKGGIKIWDLDNQKETCVLGGPANEVSQLAFSPDGKRLAAVVNQDWKVLLWEVGTWKQKSPCVGFFCSARSVAFSPDSTMIAAGLTDGTTAIWNLSNGLLPTRLQHQGSINGLAWFADNKQILTGAKEGSIKVWDIPQKREAFSLPVVSTGSILTAAVHPQKPWAATGGYSRHISLWDLKTRGELGRYTTNATIRSLKFSPDRTSMLSVGADGEICLLYLPIEARALQAYRLHRAGYATLRGVVYLDAGRKFATCDEDGLIKIWDTARFSGVRIIPARSGLRALSCSGRLAVMSNPGLPTEIIEVATGKILGAAGEHAFHDTPPIFSNSESLLIFKHDAVFVWRFGSAPPRRLTSGHGAICNLALSSDEKTLAISDRNGAIDIWNLETNQLEWTLQQGKAGVKTEGHHLQFLRDGKTLIAARDTGSGEIALWDMTSRKRIRVLETQEKEIHALGLSRDETQLAAGVGPRSLQIWDLQEGQLKANLVGNHKRVLGIAFTPDGDTLASAAEDGAIRFWHLPTRHLLFAFHNCRLIPSRLQFDESGTMLTAISNAPSDAEILVWKALGDR